MNGGSGEEEVGVLKKRDYVRVTNTADEWEDLIGVIEEFMDVDGGTTEKFHEGQDVVVFFPLTREDMDSCRLVGVNSFTGFCRYELKSHDGLRSFPVSSLEVVDPADL